MEKITLPSADQPFDPEAIPTKPTQPSHKITTNHPQKKPTILTGHFDKTELL